MAYSGNVLKSLVPITQFNRGQAARIFDRLHTENRLIVLKNNQPAAVILSPEEYERLNEIEENYTLLLEASRRMAENKISEKTMKTVMSDLGITEEELAKAEEPEFE